MVAPHYRPLRGGLGRGPPPWACGAPRRSSVSVGPRLCRRGWFCPLGGPRGPFPIGPPPLVGPRLCRRLPLLGLVGLLRGRRRVRPPWGRWAVRAFPSLGFFAAAAPAVCSMSVISVATVRHFGPGNSDRPFGRQWYTECAPQFAERRSAQPATKARTKPVPRRGLDSRSKAGKTAQGTLYALPGMVPCATSFAIEPLRPYRKSGRTANTPAQDSGRKGNAAHSEP